MVGKGQGKKWVFPPGAPFFRVEREREEEEDPDGIQETFRLSVISLYTLEVSITFSPLLLLLALCCWLLLAAGCAAAAASKILKSP